MTKSCLDPKAAECDLAAADGMLSQSLLTGKVRAVRMLISRCGLTVAGQPVRR